MENMSGRSTLVSPTYKTMLDIKRITDIDPILRKSDVTTEIEGRPCNEGGNKYRSRIGPVQSEICVDIRYKEGMAGREYNRGDAFKSIHLPRFFL
jgi:hypothetical protein